MSSSYSTVFWFSLYLRLFSEEHGLGCPPPLPLGKTNKDDICPDDNTTYDALGQFKEFDPPKHLSRRQSNV